MDSFGAVGAKPVDDVEKSEQVHVALRALTESESFDIVPGAAPSGLEAFETVDSSLGSSECRKGQSSSATNLGTRSMQTARFSRRT